MSELKQYIDEKNTMRRIFGQELLKMPTTATECDVLFEHLDADLSPENLTCDGELPANEVQRRSAHLKGAMKELYEVAGSLADRGVWL